MGGYGGQAQPTLTFTDVSVLCIQNQQLLLSGYLALITADKPGADNIHFTHGTKPLGASFWVRFFFTVCNISTSLYLKSGLYLVNTDRY